MEDRTKDGYRFGFNGKQMENEINGFGNSYDFGARIYNNRSGRFLSLDPLSIKFPWNTPYSFAENDVIRYIDKDGKFKADPEAVKQFPILKIVIEEYLPQLVYNEEIKQAFLKNLDNKMTEEEFDQMVKSGNGPTIYITDGDSKFDPIYPDRIYMNNYLVSDAQNALIKQKM